ncbi:MAG: hypothetical protein M3Q42_11115 [Pseudomonadota bacterium]|nr:hypothetical protein [Pseudomonadota bacterium]
MRTERHLKGDIGDVLRVKSKSSGRAFVAARLSILSGRSLEIKQDLSRRVLETLQQHVPVGAGLVTQVSVEVAEIDRATYAKAVMIDAQQSAQS